jgi:hypothetical protein
MRIWSVSRIVLTSLAVLCAAPMALAATPAQVKNTVKTAKTTAPKLAATPAATPPAPAALVQAADMGKAHDLDVKSIALQPTGTAHTLDIGYDIRMGGLTLMSIDLKAVVDQGHYAMTSLVSTKGLADVFVSSSVQALSTGDVIGRSIVPRSYNSDIQGGKNRQLVGLLYDDKGPLSVDAAPPYDSRFPVPEPMKLSTVDPVSGLLFIAMGSSVSPEAPCGVSVPVFDGRRRYDLKLDFSENDKVSAKGAYEGPALHCIARYQRVAGFKPPKHGRKATEVPPIDVWLAPLDNGTLLVPVRLQLDSDFGGIVARAVRLKVGGPANPG